MQVFVDADNKRRDSEEVRLCSWRRAERKVRWEPRRGVFHRDVTMKNIGSAWQADQHKRSGRVAGVV